MYLAMMGSDGLKDATAVANLNASYPAHRSRNTFPILATGRDQLVAHESIIDLRPISEKSGIFVEDVAKRLIDDGSHVPTMSWPVAGMLMIESTESELKEELDRFCEAMLPIHREIEEVVEGESDPLQNVLKNGPHTAAIILPDDWGHPYSREKATCLVMTNIGFRWDGLTMFMKIAIFSALATRSKPMPKSNYEILPDWDQWEPGIHATLMFVHQGSRVLLIEKLRGIGEGKINGPGGKIDPGETPEQCIIRECQEELHITCLDPVKRGELWFAMNDIPDIHCHVYTATQFEGMPTATDEAIPYWCEIEEIPFERMWEDDSYWLRQALAGEEFDARFLFDHESILGYDIAFGGDSRDRWRRYEVK